MFLNYIKSNFALNKCSVQKLNNVDLTHLVLLDTATQGKNFNSVNSNITMMVVTTMSTIDDGGDNNSNSNNCNNTTGIPVDDDDNELHRQ